MTEQIQEFNPVGMKFIRLFSKIIFSVVLPLSPLVEGSVYSIEHRVTYGGLSGNHCEWFCNFCELSF